MNSAGGASRRTIAKATAAAFVVAVAVLLTVVLPAEYGIDPLGTGRALGLLELYGTSTSAAPPIAPAEGGPIHPQPAKYRVDSRQLIVPSLGTIEFKYHLPKGGGLLYAWRATAPLGFDFHTEPAGKPPEASDTFERDEADAANGLYTAPYDGLHGWYWENLNEHDVTITLETAGFYSQATLFLPNRPPEQIDLAASRGNQALQ